VIVEIALMATPPPYAVQEDPKEDPKEDPRRVVLGG